MFSSKNANQYEVKNQHCKIGRPKSLNEHLCGGLYLSPPQYFSHGCAIAYNFENDLKENKNYEDK